jgi:hypothetical protein
MRRSITGEEAANCQAQFLGFESKSGRFKVGDGALRHPKGAKFDVGRQLGYVGDRW